MFSKQNFMLNKLDLKVGLLYICSMSTPAHLVSDDTPMPMTMGERVTWVYATLVPITTIAYFAVVLPRLGDTPVAEIAWQVPMLVAIAVVIGGTIVATIVSAIVAAVVTKDPHQGSDIRDTEISHRGERANLAVSGVGFALVIVMAMLDADQFVIGSTLFAVGAIGAMGASATKIRAYRSSNGG